MSSGDARQRPPSTGPGGAHLRSPRFLPPLLLLLLSPWPLRAQVPTGAGPWVAPGCPASCACAPGGQANCSGRALSAVPAGLDQRVRALLLDHNRVRALLRLDLRDNGLLVVDARAFWGLTALQQLDLGANQLEALAPGTFAPLRALRTLSLAGNRLARLDPAALGALPALRELSLQNNALAALAPGVLGRLPALRALRLPGNPWVCGCALRPLCAWLRRQPRPPPGTETPRCVWPGRLPPSPLAALPDAAFRHCARPLSARDLAVVCALGPGSFLASLAACLALGTALAACRRRRAAAHRPPPRAPEPAASA
ncbi:leucine-rich repeat-containing protein 26 [Sorex fumeus]|uniref:leucine-rich repeat-containing protein 26 n=1 Tax=Sorex fumeus TaxID=62283 RepID=UPI0024ADF3F0|nr:leucine-rich repeat-containing protein 26 [Sorex fumeus]